VKIIWSPQAADDLVENNKYIARENPELILTIRHMKRKLKEDNI
jgi:plasmid stabilization system protein ParE